MDNWREHKILTYINLAKCHTSTVESICYFALGYALALTDFDIKIKDIKETYNKYYGDSERNT